MHGEAQRAPHAAARPLAGRLALAGLASMQEEKEEEQEVEGVKRERLSWHFELPGGKRPVIRKSALLSVR